MTMLKISGVVGLKSVADTPRGVRKAGLVLAVTATKAFVLRKRVSTYDALHALTDKYRSQGRIMKSQWLEVDLAQYAVTHRFIIKGLDTEIPGTGPSPYDLGKDEFAKLTLADDIRLGCAPMNAGYALMPQVVAPEELDDDIPADECEADARDEAAKDRAHQDALALSAATDDVIL